MEPRAPAEMDLVLVGGGHAHALALRMLAMERPAGLRITLISPAPFTPYSGMLPGLLAGHYRFEETHIDLARLCAWGDVRFLADTVVDLDPHGQRLRCKLRGDIAYDLLSIDIGSEPELDSVPGARRYAIPVKPVSGLWERWQSDAEGGAMGDGPVAVVGGGAGSVEMALAIAHRLRQRSPQVDLHCGAELLPGYGTPVRSATERALRTHGVRLHCQQKVTEVADGQLRFADGTTAAFHRLIWCTGAAAAPWIAASGLPVDDRGFMEVRDTLQSMGFDNIFGAGDIASQVNHPRPKAGVYAVRQAPVLAHNLRAAATGATLKEHRPQQRFLSLLSLGGRHAVAERGVFSASGAWVWRWKDRIDRRFMDKFADLPAKAMANNSDNNRNNTGAIEGQAPCGGCGAKVTADILGDVLDELRGAFPAVTPTAAELDDAAFLAPDGALVMSLDALRALVDDPWRMGRIAAQHALSDLYASGARPHSAQALIVLPFAAPSLLRRDLRQTLAGALSVFAAVDCRLVGGHTMQGPEMQLGFAVNGALDGQPMLPKRGGLPGDRLLLTGPLGSGALFAAHMQCKADGRDVEHALATMEMGNGPAAKFARQFGARALTDVTGFGLAGHLAQMLDDNVDGVLDLDALPALPGALEAMEKGIFSTLQDGNRAALGQRVKIPDDAPLAAQLLFDPQTSGGLLMALARDLAEDALVAMRGSGIDATIIGELRTAAGSGGEIQLTRNSRILSL